MGICKIHCAAVQFAPVDRRCGFVGVLPVNDRIGHDHDDFAFGRRRSHALCGLFHGLFECIYTVVLVEPVVDQLLPLGLCRRSEFQSHHIGVGLAVDAAGYLELDGQETVEQPVLLSLLVGIGDERCEPLLIPPVRRSVRTASVAQHQVRKGEDSAAALFPGVHRGVCRFGGEFNGLQGSEVAFVVAGYGEDRVGREFRQPVDYDPVAGVGFTLVEDLPGRPRGFVVGRRAQDAAVRGVHTLYAQSHR